MIGVFEHTVIFEVRPDRRALEDPHEGVFGVL
jgi:hypothetical protein